MVKWFAIGLAALAVAGAAAWLLLRQTSEEKVVEGRLLALAEKASKSGDESPLNAIGASQGAAKLFAESCDVQIDSPARSGLYRREDVAAHCLAARAQFKSVELSLHELEVSLPSKLTAKASFTAYLSGKLNSGESVKEARDVEAQLVKIDGSWLVSSLKASNPVKK